MSVKTTFNKMGFWFRKNSPEILTITGIASSAASIYFAIRGTIKLPEKVKPYKKQLGKLNKELENALVDQRDDTEIRKKIRKAKMGEVWEGVKLYGPCALSFGLSTAAVCGSHKIMKGRNIALAAAYTTLESGYAAYRERVKAKLGEKVEEELFKDIHTDEETEPDGKVNKIKSPHLHDGEDFKYWFDASNPNWNNSGRMNLEWLLMTQKYCNDRLVANGYLFLEDVYKSLGIENQFLTERQKQMSKVVGWLYDPEDKTRDSFVSFGISDKMGNLTPYAADMNRIDDRDILLCFNPDGDILTGDHGKKTFMKYAK